MALKLLRELRFEAGGLWPAFPDKISEFKDWLQRADELLARLDEFRKDRDDLREKALPYGEEARRLDMETHLDWEDLMIIKKNRDRLAEKIGAAEGSDPGSGSEQSREASGSLARWKEELSKPAVDAIQEDIGVVDEGLNESSRASHFLEALLAQGFGNRFIDDGVGYIEQAFPLFDHIHNDVRIGRAIVHGN